MIRRKIIKIVATRCQILRLKCTKFDFGWGSARAYSALPDPLAGFKGPTSKGREGRGREGPTYKGREVKGGRGGEEGEGREKDGREMEGSTYKGREGKRERQGPPVITVSPRI